MANQGHSFSKRNFHKPSYCHHCADIVWGLLNHGHACEVCNFVAHERCLKHLVSPCSSIAASLIKNPVAHCWSEQAHHKRKYCNVCRKRLDITTDSLSVHCEICEYYAHIDCQDFAVPDCKENATYIPGKVLSQVRHDHHWREGNLQPSSKCVVCRKVCSSIECLAGFRCEWCSISCHAGCRKQISTECQFGCLEPIYLPPHAVSIPRTEVPMEAIIGVTIRRRETLSPRSISEEFSSGEGRFKENEEPGHSKDRKEREDRDEVNTMSRSRESPERGRKEPRRIREKDQRRHKEVLKVYDGNNSVRRNIYRTITVSRLSTTEYILTQALRAFHITKDPGTKTVETQIGHLRYLTNNYRIRYCDADLSQPDFYLTDLYASADTPLQDPSPIQSLARREGKRPAVFLRFNDGESSEVRVYPGKLQATQPFVTVPVNTRTTIRDLIREALARFGFENLRAEDLRLSEILLDRGVTEHVLRDDEKPLEILKSIGIDSIRQMELMRFYLQMKEDPHGPNLALFVGSLPPYLSQKNYETILTDFLGRENKFSSIGPIYYEYGSMVIVYEDAKKAVKALYTLRESLYEEKQLLVMLLPNIEPSMVPQGVQPLLVFVNVKSGGCQGLELISSFRKLLNPYQVFDLENGGPLPGLYVFRHIKDYKILVCGGDGTIGWVLQCLDNVGQDSECSSPPCAIVPLGTGNDLARVLRWGPGYTGGEDPLNLLRDVIDAEEIRLDRWTIVFHPIEDKGEDKTQQVSNTPGGGSTSEDMSTVMVMNNYMGIGIDADLCLDFHNAREENPNKFNSRLHNKGVYVKMGLRKMVGRKLCKDLQREIKLEVDGKAVDLPPVEGIIILNILSWGSGANPWGPEKDDQFTKPNHWDGVLEVVGVTGVVHLGQIQSGLRSAMRIAQGGHIKIHLQSDMPIQLDGEPWLQPPCEVVVLKSALKLGRIVRASPKFIQQVVGLRDVHINYYPVISPATMLKKMKGKMKRRNTEPFMCQGAPIAGSGGPAGASGGPAGLSIPVVAEQGEGVNHSTEF